MGPVVPHWALSFKTNQKNDHIIFGGANIVYEKDIHVASKVDYNMKDSKMTYAGGILAWKNQEWGQLWFRSNCLSNFMGLGW